MSPATTIDPTTDEGFTIQMIQGLRQRAARLAKRNLTSPLIQAFLAELRADPAMKNLMEQEAVAPGSADTETSNLGFSVSPLGSVVIRTLPLPEVGQIVHYYEKGSRGCNLRGPYPAMILNAVHPERPDSDLAVLVFGLYQREEPEYRDMVPYTSLEHQPER